MYSHFLGEVGGGWKWTREHFKACVFFYLSSLHHRYSQNKWIKVVFLLCIIRPVSGICGFSRETVVAVTTNYWEHGAQKMSKCKHWIWKASKGWNPRWCWRVYCTFPSIFRNDIHSQGTKSPVALDCEVHFCFKSFVDWVKISHSRFYIESQNKGNAV